jgi:hypothetical protein
MPAAWMQDERAARRDRNSGGGEVECAAKAGRAVDVAINHDPEANSVCPPLSRAIAMANYADQITERMVA